MFIRPTDEITGFGCGAGTEGCLTSSLGGATFSLGVGVEISVADCVDRVRPFK